MSSSGNFTHRASHQITEVTKTASIGFDQERFEHFVSPAYPAIASPSVPCCPETSIPIDGQFGDSLAERKAHHETGNYERKPMYVHLLHQYPAQTVDRCDIARVTIDTLPDVALLELFDFYVGEAQILQRGHEVKKEIEAWNTLVHVCRKWRIVVFGSPHRLDLRLHCSTGTPVRKLLDVWPLLPLVIRGGGGEKWGMNNIAAALEHNNRTRMIDLWRVSRSQMEEVLAAMQQPFPVLTSLSLQAREGTVPVIPASFLGGSAPRLQHLFLRHISFPGLPKLLLSATHLAHLFLSEIPYIGYPSPESMVNGLSLLTRLKTLTIRFNSPRCRPDRRTRRPPLLTRILLPVLTRLQFSGVCEYLEDLVARIDAPLLHKLEITFFNQLIFDTLQLTQFISRAPEFKSCDQAHVHFFHSYFSITFKAPSPQTFYRELVLEILCCHPDWQLSSLAQVCSSLLPQALIPMAKLYIDDEMLLLFWKEDDFESSQWLEFLRLFAAVKDLYISQKFVSSIAPALQELVGERVTEVLPALQTLFLEMNDPSGSVEEAIRQFVAARQLANRPVAISRWERSQ